MTATSDPLCPAGGSILRPVEANRTGSLEPPTERPDMTRLLAATALAVALVAGGASAPAQAAAPAPNPRIIKAVHDKVAEHRVEQFLRDRQRAVRHVERFLQSRRGLVWTCPPKKACTLARFR